MIQPVFQASYTATAATTTIVTGGVVEIHTVVLPKATAGTLSYQDASGNVYFAVAVASGPATLLLDMVCNNGLKVVQSSAADQVITTYQIP